MTNRQINSIIKIGLFKFPKGFDKVGRGMPITKDSTVQMLSIAEACDYLGVSRATLLRTEEDGLIQPARTRGGHRRYAIKDLERLLRRSRKTFTLEPDTHRLQPTAWLSTVICKLVANPKSGKDVVNEAIQKVVQFFQLDFGALFTLDAQNTPHLYIAHNVSPEIARTWAKTSASRRALQDKQPVVFDQGTEVLPGIYRPFQAACVPLVHLGVNQGVIYLVSIHHHHFLPSEVNVLTTIAIYLSALIAENRHFLQHQHLREELQLIERATQIEMNTGESLNLFLQDILKAMRADAGAVLLQDPSQGDYYVHAMLGYSESMRDLRLKSGEGIIGQVIEHGRAYSTVNLSSDPHLLLSEKEFTRNMSSTICIPLKVKEKVIGVFHISTHSPRRFTLGEERLLATIANKAALTMDRTYLYNRMAELAEQEATIEKFYEDVIEEMPIAAKVIDKGLTILKFNKAMEYLCEFNRENAIGRNEFEALPVLTTSKETMALFNTVLRTSQPVGCTYLPISLFHKNKPETIFDVKFLPLRDAKGKMVNIVLFVQDVTELESLRNKLAMYSPFG